jgi:hypothetical protein
MAEAGIVSRVLLNNRQAFQPATHLENLTFSKVINNYENFGRDDSKYIKTESFAKIEKHLKNLKKSLSESEHDILLKDIIL